MKHRHIVLVIHPQQLSLYHYRRQALRCLEQGVDEHSLHTYLQQQQYSNIPWNILLDIPEEHFSLIHTPPLAWWQRRMVLTQCLQQHYAQYRYRVATPQQHQPHGDEAWLLAAITDTQRLDSYLQAIHHAKICLQGIYSSALLLPELLKMLHPRINIEQPLLLIQRQAKQLRQSYFQQRCLYFSRLSPQQDSALIDSLKHELSRCLNFLQRSDYLPSNIRILAVIIVSEAELAELSARVPVALQSLGVDYCWVSLNQLAKTWQHSYPYDAYDTLPLLLELLARQRRDHYAHHEQLQRYRQQQQRQCLQQIAQATLFGATLLSSYYGWHSYQQQQQFTQLTQQFLLQQQRYQQIQAQPKPTALSLAELQQRLYQYQQISRRWPVYSDSLLRLSQALSNLPAITLQQIDWLVACDTSQQPLRLTMHIYGEFHTLAQPLQQHTLEQLQQHLACQHCTTRWSIDNNHSRDDKSTFVFTFSQQLQPL